MADIAVIGLGVIGGAVLKELSKKVKVTGVDISQDILNSFKSEGYTVVPKLETPQDVYIVCTYSTESVIAVVRNLDYSRKPLVVIESTTKPGTHGILEEIVVKNNKSNLLIFPHRFNPNDPEHHVFNLNRVIGGATPECIKRGVEFY